MTGRVGGFEPEHVAGLGAVDDEGLGELVEHLDEFAHGRVAQTEEAEDGLNGIVAIEGALVVGHSATGGLLRVSLGDPSQVEVISTGVEGMSIDGLHLSDDGSTLVVVSNLGGAVHVFESHDGWSTATQRFDTGATFPTSVTDRDGDFHVLQAHRDQLPDLPFDTLPRSGCPGRT